MAQPQSRNADLNELANFTSGPKSRAGEIYEAVAVLLQHQALALSPHERSLAAEILQRTSKGPSGNS